MTTPATPDDRPAAPTGAAGPVSRGRKPMELPVLLAVLVGWIVLRVRVLPKLGVRT